MNTKYKEKKFNEVSKEWLYFKKLSIKRSTYDKYEVIITNHLSKRFNEYMLKDIDDQLIISYFHDLNDNQTYSLSTIKTIRYVLKAVLDYAQEKYGFYSINFKLIKLAKESKEFVTLTTKQRKLLEEYCFNHYENISLAILLSLYGGFRVGEVTGLKWEDIDFNKGIIYVNRTIERLKNDENPNIKTKLVVLQPKTTNSKRIVPMPKFILKYIEKYIEIYRYSSSDNFIYNNSDHIPDPRNVQYHFKRICKLLGFNINYHSLRHSYATSCVMNDIDIKSLSEILGHSSVSITLELYVHSSLEFKMNQICKIKKPSYVAEL
ncbi:MAG: site-specific integrase [Erysipelotrichia bacterium]|nr:site-specific integrase [Erysipelotrichia bacterium]